MHSEITEWLSLMIILIFRDDLESKRLQDHTYGGDRVSPIIKR